MKQLSIIIMVLSLIALTIPIVKSIQLEQNCIGYLERASNANTVETAIEELNYSISYLEENELTTGYTSVFYRTPDEDINFFYKNLVNSRDELMKVDSTTTQMEKTNLLMKLRETLTYDGGDYGTIVTYPDGLSRYPNNGMWMFIISISLLCLFGFGFYLLLETD